MQMKSYYYLTFNNGNILDNIQSYSRKVLFAKLSIVAYYYTLFIPLLSKGYSSNRLFFPHIQILAHGSSAHWNFPLTSDHKQISTPLFKVSSLVTSIMKIFQMFLIHTWPFFLMASIEAYAHLPSSNCHMVLFSQFSYLSHCNTNFLRSGILSFMHRHQLLQCLAKTWLPNKQLFLNEWIIE